MQHTNKHAIKRRPGASDSERSMYMKVSIVEGCIGCGMCAGTCPEVFRMQDDGTAEVYHQPETQDEPLAKEAAEGCPVGVIVIE